MNGTLITLQKKNKKTRDSLQTNSFITNTIVHLSLQMFCAWQANPCKALLKPCVISKWRTGGFFCLAVTSISHSCRFLKLRLCCEVVWSKETDSLTCFKNKHIRCSSIIGVIEKFLFVHSEKQHQSKQYSIFFRIVFSTIWSSGQWTSTTPTGLWWYDFSTTFCVYDFTSETNLDIAMDLPWH